MRRIEMNGPFMLNVGSIERNLGNVVSPGVAIFGSFDIQGAWRVQAIERSDAHLRARLWASAAEYPFFSYRLCSTAEEAYNIHCELFHQYALKPSVHPCAPDNTRLVCSVCHKSGDCEHSEQSTLPAESTDQSNDS